MKQEVLSSHQFLRQAGQQAQLAGHRPARLPHLGQKLSEAHWESALDLRIWQLLWCIEKRPLFLLGLLTPACVQVHVCGGGCRRKETVLLLKGQPIFKCSHLFPLNPRTLSNHVQPTTQMQTWTASQWSSSQEVGSLELFPPDVF